MKTIQYPNKTFVFEKTYDHYFGRSTQFVVIAASDKEIAAEYIKDKLGFDVQPNELTWLTDANYKIIYNQNGQKPLEPQVKILYNTSVHYENNS